MCEHEEHRQGGRHTDPGQLVTKDLEKRVEQEGQHGQIQGGGCHHRGSEDDLGSQREGHRADEGCGAAGEPPENKRDAEDTDPGRSGRGKPKQGVEIDTGEDPQRGHRAMHPGGIHGASRALDGLEGSRSDVFPHELHVRERILGRDHGIGECILETEKDAQCNRESHREGCDGVR